MTVWHEHLELREPFPPAKKIFNFMSNEAAHGLAVFSESDAHKILRGVMDVETWLVATYFAERVLSLAEKKEQKECSFTCLFKFKEPAKNLHVTVRIERNKNEELHGEVIMRGHRKEPTPEIVNLISAVLIDDVWLSKHWGKMLCVFGTAFAWFKRGSIKRSRSTSMLPVSEDVGIKIPLKQDHVPPAQSCKLGDVRSQPARREVFVQTSPLPEPEIKYSQDGEAQTDPLPESEVKLAQDGEAQTVPVLVPLEKEIGIGAAHVDPVVKKMRDAATQTLAPKPIPVPRKPVLRTAASQTERTFVDAEAQVELAGPSLRRSGLSLTSDWDRVPGLLLAALRAECTREAKFAHIKDTIRQDEHGRIVLENGECTATFGIVENNEQLKSMQEIGTISENNVGGFLFCANDSPSFRGDETDYLPMSALTFLTMFTWVPIQPFLLVRHSVDKEAASVRWGLVCGNKTMAQICSNDSLEKSITVVAKSFLNFVISYKDEGCTQQ